MKLVTNMFGELGSAVKKALQGPHETDLIIPASLLPILNLRNVLRTGASPPVATGQETTFVAQLFHTVGNAALNVQLVCTINPGLWEISFQQFYSSNYAAGFPNGGQVFITLGGSATNLSVISSEQVAGASFGITRTIVFEFDAQATISGQLSANGAGQSHSQYVAIIASRIL